MFKLFDYKLWLIVGLIFLVLYLYFELNNVKAKLEKFENSKDNLPKNLQDVPSQSDSRAPVKLPPISTPSEVINMGNLKETRIILKGDENHQSSKEEDDSSSTSDIDSESDHDDLTSDYPIYSNDNDNADEIISINVTENIGEDVQKILEEALMDNDKEKEEEEIKEEEIKEEIKEEEIKEEKVNSKVLLENSEEKQIEKLDLEKLDKLKKDDLTSLALKYQISLIKTENGKMKNKTKKELIDEILIQNNL